MNYNKLHQLPEEIIKIVVSHITTPDIFYTTQEIKENCKQYLHLFLIFKLYSTEIDKYNTLFKLIKKYSKYQDDHDRYISYTKTPLSKKDMSLKDIAKYSNPILFDLLFTGCMLPYAEHSYQYFTDQIYEDLKVLLCIMPSSIHSNSGRLRCRYNVTPLCAAIFNNNIPRYVVKLLLDKGANKNVPILFNGHEMDILDDLHYNDKLRHTWVKQLFDKY
tara:strand:+ start:737 stop:1390 length:654 start_codon:yes stop_codon:yes gene_type:complete